MANTKEFSNASRPVRDCSLPVLAKGIRNLILIICISLPLVQTSFTNKEASKDSDDTISL